MTSLQKTPDSDPRPAIGRSLLFYAASVLVFILSSGIAKKTAYANADLLTMLLAAVLSFSLVYIFTRWERCTLAAVGLVPGKKSLLRFSTGFLAGIAMAAGQVLLEVIFGHARLVMSSQRNAGGIAVAILLYFLAASREEVVFRSYFLRNLGRVTNVSVALAIVTCTFILEHILGGQDWRTALVGSGLGGILFGLAAWRTKGLALPLGLHFAWNAGQWAFGLKGSPGIWETVTDKAYQEQAGTVGLLAFAIVMIIAIAGVIRYARE